MTRGVRIPLLPPTLHTTDRPSSTAQWTTLSRALELRRRERIVTDRYAPALLRRRGRVLLTALGAAGTAQQAIERLPLLGLAASALCRHRFIDEHLVAALPEAEQVLILGAGYDSRAYRFASALGPRPVYEVDLPPLSQRKARVVASRPELFGHVTIRRVEIDFRTQSLTERLAGAGFETGARTFVVWEGVSPYLDRRAVDGTLAALAAVCGRGSRLALDCWQTVGGPGGYPFRMAAALAMRLIGEPITFTVPATAAAALLAPHGFAVDDLAEADELTARYATGGRVCDPGMYLVSALLG